MAAHHGRIEIPTEGRVSVRNITDDVARALAGSPVRDGLALVSVRHATCALVLNEDEAGLRRDLERLATSLLDPVRAAAPFLHDRIDDNAQAHLTSVVLGPSVSLPFAGGRPVFGTWQSLLLVELDGPRTRRVDLTVVG